MSIKFDSNFKNRFKELRTRGEPPLTQKDLSIILGISSRQIIAYESGHATPRKALLLKIARFFNVSPGWIACGDSSVSFDEWEEFIPKTEVYQIPLYSWEDFDHTLLEFQPRPTINNRLHPCSFPVKPSFFALQIQGDSMLTSNGLGFPDSSIVIFDTEFNKSSGGFYLFMVEDEYSFKQLFFDTLGTTMTSLNKDYASFTAKNNEYKLLAKAVYAEICLAQHKNFPEFVYREK